jgi:hypothetical protein
MCMVLPVCDFRGLLLDTKCVTWLASTHHCWYAMHVAVMSLMYSQAMQRQSNNPYTNHSLGASAVEHSRSLHMPLHCIV